MTNGKPCLPWFVEQMKNMMPKSTAYLRIVQNPPWLKGALDSKTKLLIVLALDALKGAAQG